MRQLLRGHREKVLYVVVGVWNTVFGYSLYAVAVTVLGDEHYVWLLVPTSIIAITQNYFAYKFLVFRTRSNYLREYLRFYLVYGPVVLANLLVLPALVRWLSLEPVVAQALFTLLAVVVTYAGHKYFTFREPEDVFEKSGQGTSGASTE